MASCTRKATAKCMIPASTAADYQEVFDNACGGVGTNFPTLYETAACQAVCGLPQGSNTDNFYSEGCVTKLLNFCLNRTGLEAVDISTGAVVSTVNTVTNNGLSGREDERSMRNYPITYSPICQDNLIALLRMQQRTDNSFVRQSITDALKDFCTASAGRVFKNQIAGGTNWSFTKLSDVPKYDKASLDAPTVWRIVSKAMIPQDQDAEEFLANLQLRDMSPTALTDNVVPALLHVDGGDIKPLSRITMNCGGTKSRFPPFSRSGTLQFLATSRVLANSGFTYIELMKLFETNGTAPTAASLSPCDSGGSGRQSDLIVIRSAKIQTNVYMAGNQRHFSFIAELRAKIQAISLGAISTVNIDKISFTQQLITLQLTDIYVNTPYIPIYSSLSCGCFAPWNSDAIPNTAPDTANDPQCGVSTANTRFPKCRVGWNGLGDAFSTTGVRPEVSVSWDVQFYRDSRGDITPITKFGSDANAPAETLHDLPKGGGLGYEGAIAINQQRPRNFLLEFCACHLPQEIYKAFSVALENQQIPVDAVADRLECLFPGCQSSRFPSLNIAAKSGNTCKAPPAIQSVIFNIDDITAGRDVIVNVVVANNSTTSSVLNPAAAVGNGATSAQVTAAEEEDYGLTDFHPDEERTQSSATIILGIGSGTVIILLILIVLVAYHLYK